MLEWAAEQAVEITQAAIDSEFGDAELDAERYVEGREAVCQRMHTALMSLTHGEAGDIVANSRKNPLEAWRRLHKRFDPTTGGRLYAARSCRALAAHVTHS